MCVQLLQITARNEGQVSLLAKKNGHTSISTCTYSDDSNSKLKSTGLSIKVDKKEKIEKCENYKKGSDKRVMDCRDDPPPGTVYPRSQNRVTSDRAQNRVTSDSPKGCGREEEEEEAEEEAVGVGSIMSCSDKIAKWNALGTVGISICYYCCRDFYNCS